MFKLHKWFINFSLWEQMLFPFDLCVSTNFKEVHTGDVIVCVMKSFRN